MPIETSTERPAAMPGVQPPQIEVRRVSKAFGPTRALIDVSLTVRRGETRALLGRNGAGKSTLVGLLTGMLRPDSGEIVIGGEAAGAARSVSCVYQHSHLVPAMTVAENIAIGNYPRRPGRRIDWKAVRARAVDALRPWGLEHVVDRPVEKLEPVQVKVVEICRALAQNPLVLMLDEPTAGLDRQDAEQLFTFIDTLKQKSVTLIYVSHHLDEVYRFCDSATVLRDSRVAADAPLDCLPKAELIAAMTGEAQAENQSRWTAPARRTAVSGTAGIGLTIKNLSVPGRVHDFSLQVARGECVGVAGLDGSGKAEIGAVLSGLLTPASGTITIGDRRYRPRDVRTAIDAGIGYVPPNRHQQGIVPQMTITDNSTLTAVRKLSRKVVPGVLSALWPSDCRRVFERLAAQWDIVAASPDQLISQLSGGNQQKCVMARAIATHPEILVLQNPTAGVDVAAKASIMRSLEDMLRRGLALVVISEDADDFVLASRIVVLNHGRVVDELGAEWTDRELVATMQGGLQ